MSNNSTTKVDFDELVRKAIKGNVGAVRMLCQTDSVPKLEIVCYLLNQEAIDNANDLMKEVGAQVFRLRERAEERYAMRTRSRKGKEDA